VPSKTRLSDQEFLSCVREYLPIDATIRETDASGNPGQSALTDELSENTFYIFDAEAANAVCHAIEDLALEEANGSLLAGFQEFSYFDDAHRERYDQLAATIEQVKVLAAGKTPRSTRHLKFTRDVRGACKEFQLVLYDGHRRQALFVGRQIKKTRALEEREFLGFYTFSLRLIGRIRQDVLNLAGGRGSSLREFTRQHAIDQAAKQLKTEFSRQKKMVDTAVRRLQLDGERYRAGHFASDLEKGLSRLHQWKTRMPEILARAERR
jgi:hypothetical protein